MSVDELEEGCYVVTAYYHSSECSYAFGPLNSNAELKAAARKLEADPNIDSWSWMVVNPPHLYRTGRELS